MQHPSFNVDATLLRDSLIKNGYLELNINANNVLAVASLPNFHKDPFDRLLIAQSITENMQLMTSDNNISQYGKFVINI